MKTFEITGQIREHGTKGDLNYMRKNERVPAVMYGHGDPVMMSFDRVQVDKALNTPATYILQVDLDGKKVDTIIRETQFHPVTDRVIHLDLMRITDKDEIELQLPVKLTGSAAGVLEGGKLMQIMRRIKVRGIPAKLPEVVEVDISELGLGKTIKVSDVPFEGMTITSPAGAGIAAVEIPRALRGKQSEEGEGEEGEEAEATE